MLDTRETLIGSKDCSELVRILFLVKIKIKKKIRKKTLYEMSARHKREFSALQKVTSEG